MAVSSNTTPLPRRHLLAGIFGVAAVAAVPATRAKAPEPKRWATKWGPDGPLRADDVTGTNDYAEWAASEDAPYRNYA